MDRTQDMVFGEMAPQSGGNDNAAAIEGLQTKRRKHYGKPLTPISRLPEPGSRAREIIEDRICSLFRDGKDTMYIAGAVNLTEAIVYNVLAEAAE